MGGGEVDDYWTEVRRVVLDGRFEGLWWLADGRGVGADPNGDGARGGPKAQSARELDGGSDCGEGRSAREAWSRGEGIPSSPKCRHRPWVQRWYTGPAEGMMKANETA